jgi:hypothetical protein
MDSKNRSGRSNQLSTPNWGEQLKSKLKANRERLDDLLSQLLTQPAYTWQDVKDREALSLAQQQYGVYHFFQVGEDGDVTSIYVGESHTISDSADLATRARDHFRPGNPRMGNLSGNLVRAGHQADYVTAADFVKKHYSLQYLVLSTPVAARELEHYAIAALHPRYNFIIGNKRSRRQPRPEPLLKSTTHPRQQRRVFLRS